MDYFDPEPDPRAHRSAQPGLFNQRQVKPVTQHRYQRGYTPERMGEVHDALTDFNEEGNLVSKQRPSLDMVRPEFRGMIARRQSAFREAVARSTMDVEPLAAQVTHVMHNTGVHTTPEGRRMAGTAGVTSTMASENPQTGERKIGQSAIDLFHGSETVHSFHEKKVASRQATRQEIMDAVAIHELGHATKAFTEPGSMGVAPVGHHEHFADQFAIQHHRPHPKEVKRGQAIDARDMSYPARLQERSEQSGYPGWNEAVGEARHRYVEKMLEHPNVKNILNESQTHQPGLF